MNKKQNTDTLPVAKVQEIAAEAVQESITEIIEGDIDLTGYVKEDAEQTLTNKTLTTPIIASIKPSADHTLALPDVNGTLATTDDIPTLSNAVTLNGEETLTNKTLTEPIIATIKNGGASITVPSSSGTLVLTDLAQNLLNKSLYAPTIYNGLLRKETVDGSTVIHTLILPFKDGTLATMDDIPAAPSTVLTYTTQSTPSSAHADFSYDHINVIYNVNLHFLFIEFLLRYSSTANPLEVIPSSPVTIFSLPDEFAGVNSANPFIIRQQNDYTGYSSPEFNVIACGTCRIYNGAVQLYRAYVKKNFYVYCSTIVPISTE